MAKTKHTGVCHICGQQGPLTFEHVPPKAAFNDTPVVLAELTEVLDSLPGQRMRGPQQQRGAGYYTLCSSCNNRTGSWYGARFVGWCRQGMEMMQVADGRPTLSYPHYLFPLSIIKQIATVFASLCPPEFSVVHREFRKFLLNREARYLSPKFRFFAYFLGGGRIRHWGPLGKLDIKRPGHTELFAELAFPPFGYLMTLDSEPPDRRLLEITHFTRYEYDDFRVMHLPLPVLETYSPMPGDYRKRHEVYPELSA